MKQAAIIRELRSDAVHDRDRAFPDTMDKARNSKVTFPSEYQRIEPGISQARVNHVHTLQAGDRSQKECIVQDHQIAAFDQGNSHSSRQESVFRVNGARHPWSQQDHGWVGLGRDRSQLQQNRCWNIGNRFDRLALKQFGQNARQKPPVLNHVGETGSVTEIVVLDQQPAGNVPANAKPAEMQKMSATRSKPDRASLVVLASQNDRNGNDSLPQDLSGTVDIFEKHFERANPLLEPTHHLAPFVARENLG